MSSKTSWKTLSSMSPVRSPKCPPSPPLLDPLLTDISTRNLQGIFLGAKKNVIHDVRNDHVLHVSGQEPSMSSKYPTSLPPLLDTLLIDISTLQSFSVFSNLSKHLQYINTKIHGIFLRVYQDNQ